MRSVAVLGVLVVLLALGACEREQKAIEQDLPATRVAKARADVQQIAAAVRLYQASFGALPASLEALTRAQTGGGVTSGPAHGLDPGPAGGVVGVPVCEAGRGPIHRQLVGRRAHRERARVIALC